MKNNNEISITNVIDTSLKFNSELSFDLGQFYESLLSIKTAYLYDDVTKKMMKNAVRESKLNKLNNIS